MPFYWKFSLLIEIVHDNHNNDDNVGKNANTKTFAKNKYLGEYKRILHSVIDRGICSGKNSPILEKKHIQGRKTGW